MRVRLQRRGREAATIERGGGEHRVTLLGEGGRLAEDDDLFGMGEIALDVVGGNESAEKTLCVKIGLRAGGAQVKGGGEEGKGDDVGLLQLFRGLCVFVDGVCGFQGLQLDHCLEFDVEGVDLEPEQEELESLEVLVVIGQGQFFDAGVERLDDLEVRVLLEKRVCGEFLGDEVVQWE